MKKFVLPNFIPFLLYRIMAKGIGLASEDYAKLGLGITDARVMMVLLHNPDITVGKLASISCIEQSALSHMLRRLARARLLARQRHDEDSRSVTVRLTAKGAAVASTCSEIALRHEQIMIAGLDRQQAKLLRDHLHQVFENTEQHITNSIELAPKRPRLRRAGAAGKARAVSGQRHRR